MHCAATIRLYPLHACAIPSPPVPSDCCIHPVGRHPHRNFFSAKRSYTLVNARPSLVRARMSSRPPHPIIPNFPVPRFQPSSNNPSPTNLPIPAPKSPPKKSAHPPNPTIRPLLTPAVRTFGNGRTPVQTSALLLILKSPKILIQTAAILSTPKFQFLVRAGLQKLRTNTKLFTHSSGILPPLPAPPTWARSSSHTSQNCSAVGTAASPS